MVFSEEKRKALATKLNSMVDVPLLNEAQEQMIAETLINTIISPLESALPSDTEMTQMAKSSGEESMQKSVKESVVEKINKKIDIPLINENQEAMLFNMIVDVVLKDKFEEIHNSMEAETAAATAAEATTTNDETTTEASEAPTPDVTAEAPAADA